MLKPMTRVLKTTISTGVFVLAASGIASAQDVTVSVQNLTQGIYFTPILISAHGADSHLFQSGQAASTSLQAMAEGGDISGLAADLAALSAQSVENPAGGLLGPAQSATATTMTTDGTSNTHLSIVAMMLPTNDGFIGLDGWEIPSAAGTYTLTLNAYDAGTEANNELINSDTGGVPGTAGIPAAPGGDAGMGGSGVTSQETNSMVHIHRGTLGDMDTDGGASDLDSRIHRWLNPVARVTVVVE